jgi:hypothetical protein
VTHEELRALAQGTLLRVLDDAHVLDDINAGELAGEVVWLSSVTHQFAYVRQLDERYVPDPNEWYLRHRHLTEVVSEPLDQDDVPI